MNNIESGALDTCQYDCEYLCMGCDKYYHQIKEEEGLPHDEELPLANVTIQGTNYCSDDCFLREG